MRQKSVHPESPSERIVKNIRRATRKRHSSEEKIRIVLDGLRGESSIAELCRREGIAEGLYYAWSKEFLEAGKRRLAVADPPAQRRQLLDFSLNHGRATAHVRRFSTASYRHGRVGNSSPMTSFWELIPLAPSKSVLFTCEVTLSPSGQWLYKKWKGQERRK